MTFPRRLMDQRFSGVLLHKSSTQASENASAETILTWQTVEYDTDDYADLGASATEVVIPFPGIFVAKAGYSMTGGATSNAIGIEVDGTGVVASQGIGSNYSPQASCATPALVLEAGAVLVANCFTVNSRTIAAIPVTFFSVECLGLR